MKFRKRYKLQAEPLALRLTPCDLEDLQREMQQVQHAIACGADELFESRGFYTSLGDRKDEHHEDT